MDTASLPNVLIMCLVFSSYMNVYCLIRAGSVCDYGCVFLYSFQWKILQLPRIFFFCPYQDVCGAKICLQTGEVLPEMWEFNLPRSCLYGISLMIMWRAINSGRKWKVFFFNLSFRKKLCETFVSLFEGTDVCIFVSILHHIQCSQMGIKWTKIN